MTLSILQALAAGILIGTGFSWMQLQALRRNELLERQQKLPKSYKLLPGSGGRVAVLLLALVAVQYVLPEVNKWWLTGTLLVTVGAPTLWRLKTAHCNASR